MGLDQYFRDVKYVDVFQLRKVNCVHGWMERRFGEIENCRDYPLEKQDLEALLADCEEVIEASRLVDGKVINGQKFENGELVDIVEDGKVIEDPTTAQRLLPTVQGFFFGSQQYDEWYLNDIKDLADMCEVMIKEYDSYNNLCYHAWW